MKTYVIADIAGRYNELLKLIEQFEQPSNIIAVGDLVDRGSQSRQVLEYFMAHPEHKVCLGNHELMMLDYFGRTNKAIIDEGHELPTGEDADPEIWLWNGGKATLKSFGIQAEDGSLVLDEQAINKCLDWLEQLSLRFETEVDGKNYFISHAPAENPNKMPWRELPRVVWNRQESPRNPKYALQIYGHNSRLKWFADELGNYAVCIDDCHKDWLTALELPTGKILHQQYE